MKILLKSDLDAIVAASTLHSTLSAYIDKHYPHQLLQHLIFLRYSGISRIPKVKPALMEPHYGWEFLIVMG